MNQHDFFEKVRDNTPQDLNKLLNIPTYRDPFENLHPVATLQDVQDSLEIAMEQFNEQYREMLQEQTYAEVVSSFGPHPDYHPCDDYTHNCSLLCELFDKDCPYAPKVAIPEEVKPKPKKSRRKRKKKK